MFRSITLVCALAHAGSIRIVKTAGTDNTSFVSARETQLVERRTSFSDSVDSTLRAMGTTQDKVVGDMIGGIATLNFDRDLLPQLTNLVKKGAISLAQGFVTSVNPLLGVVFSICSALFGWGGDEKSNMVQQILDQVSTMITQSLKRFSLGLAKAELSGLKNSIEIADNNSTQWGHFPLTVGHTFSKVFGACWNGNTTTPCKNYRTKENAGAALMLEMQFTNLMVTSAVTVARYGHKFRVFAGLVMKAAALTREHWDAFQDARRDTGSADVGLDKGRVWCAGRPIGCWADATKDGLTKKDICAVPRTTGLDQTRAQVNATVVSRQQNCINQYISKMTSNIDKMGREIMKTFRAARKIQQVESR